MIVVPSGRGNDGTDLKYDRVLAYGNRPKFTNAIHTVIH